MKKLALALIAAVIVIGSLVSCNKSVCPAYVKSDTPATVEKNG
jgi:hypothetical protein